MAEKYHRGDIVWANLNPAHGHEQKGIRPVLILSQDTFNHHSKTVIAVALTSKPQKASFPLSLKLKDKIDGKTAWVKISQVRVLSHERLKNKIGALNDITLLKIIEGLNEIMGV